MSSIKIPVYEGNNLRKDKKILVVGESYYSDESRYYNGEESVLKKFPKLVMDHYFDQNKGNKWDITFFNRITEFLKSNSIIKSSLQEVYYYNYVQKILQRTINGKRNKADWGIDIKSSTAAFYEMINQIKPDIIVFFSFSSFDAAAYYMNAPTCNYYYNETYSARIYKNSKVSVGELRSDTNIIEIFRFPHLTGGPVGWSFEGRFNNPGDNVELTKVKSKLSKYRL